MSPTNNGLHSRRTTREMGGTVSNGNRSSSNSRSVGNDYGEKSALQQQRRRKKKKSTTKYNIIAVGYLLIIMYWYRNIFDENDENNLDLFYYDDSNSIINLNLNRNRNMNNNNNNYYYSAQAVPSVGRAHQVAGICCIQKGGVPYIDEWIDYNLAIGFQYIIIYDNSDHFELKEWYNQKKEQIFKYEYEYEYYDKDNSTTVMMNNTSIHNGNTLRQQQQQQHQHRKEVVNRVSIIHYPGQERQIHAYAECAKMIQNSNDENKKKDNSNNNRLRKKENSNYNDIAWIAFIDIDEFFVIQNTTKYSTITELLHTYLPVDDNDNNNNNNNADVIDGGLAIDWEEFYMNNNQNHTRTSKSSSSTSADSLLSGYLDSNNRTIPVTYRFRTRNSNAERNKHIKTIAKTSLIHSISQPHYVDYIPRSRWHFFFRRRTIRTIDTNHQTVVGPYSNNAYRNNNNAFPNNIIQNNNTNNHNHNVVVGLHHYYTKSLQEFKERCIRGRADLPKSEWNKTIPCQSDQDIMNHFYAPTTNNSNKNDEQTSVWDDSAWKVLTTRLPFKYKE